MIDYCPHVQNKNDQNVETFYIILFRKVSRSGIKITYMIIKLKRKYIYL